jgi:RNA polymerase sigma-70 factor (ECF subfamily)
MMTLAPVPRAAGPLPGPNDAGCDEAALIRETVAGNSRAFAEIVRIHHHRVFSFLYQMTRHHQDAEDLAQQTFIKAFHHLGRFDQQRPLINWLFTIARNNALNHFRDAKKWTELPDDAACSEPTPARRFEEKEQTANLWERARAKLSQREFEVLWLRFAEEMSTRETARVVGLTETHVKVLVFRARQALLKEAQPQ